MELGVEPVLRPSDPGVISSPARAGSCTIRDADTRNPLVGALGTLLAPPVLTYTAGLVTVLGVLVIALHLATLPPLDASGGQPETGDFLAFYTGAAMIDAGMGDQLFDLDAQRHFQADLLGVEPDVDWQPYVNPPLLAVVLAPAVRFGYHAALAWFDLLNVLCFAFGALALRCELPRLTGRRIGAWTVLFVVLSVPPMLRAMFVGQNTTMTLGLLGVCYAAHRRGRPILLGLALGLMTFKPQYVVVVGLLLLLRREILPLLVAGALALAHFGLGAWATVGLWWPLDMLALLERYKPMDQASFGAYHFSIPMSAHASLPEPLARIVVPIAVVAIVGVVVRAFWGRRVDDPGFPVAWALLIAGSMFASPHLAYYEVGLLTLPVLLAVEHRIARGPLTLAERLGLAALWLSYYTWSAADVLGFQPLTLVLAALVIGLARTASSAQPASTAT